ncbi:MAG: hypothetical protein E6H04_04625, partial [Bacillati bacterium ANGP1]
MFRSGEPRDVFHPMALLGILAVAAALAAGVDAAPASLEDAARQEGKVIVYGSIESETMGAISKAFTQKYGVGVDYWRGASNKVMDRTQTEFLSGRPASDVVLTNRGPMQLLKKHGVFARYLSPQNANFPPGVKDP